MSPSSRNALFALGLVVILSLVVWRGRHFAHRLLEPHTSGLSASTALIDRLDQHLVVLNANGTLAPLDSAALKNVKYFAFYFSASWCPPCQAFTPKLVEFYKSFKPRHPDFELVLVNHDNSTEDMLAYMKNDAMPWPAVRYDDIDATGLNKLDSDGGIPDLVLLDADSKVLSDAYIGIDYVGPEKVVDDIKRLMP